MTAARIEASDVVVVGAGSGIGRAVALALAERGARVTAAGRRRSALDETRDLGGSSPGRIDVCELDVTDEASVTSLFGRYGSDRQLDGLVNAAGISDITPSTELEDEQLWHVLDVNLVGAFRLSRAAGRVMLPARTGSIVHIGSLTSSLGLERRVAYVASKHGLLGMVRALATEWADRGVRVNLLSPGFVSTAMTDKAVRSRDLDRGIIESRTPLGRWAEPDDMVGPALFLLSPESGFVTGAQLAVDGGWTADIGFRPERRLDE